MGAYLLWEGGSVHFDVVIGESVQISASLPEHPVERGANVADHVKPELNRVRLDVFVSNSPIEDVAGRGASVQPRATGVGVDTNVLTFPQAFDAIRETVATLEKLRDDGTLVDVVTHARYVESMALESVESKPKGDSAELTIAFKQVKLVTTKSVKLAAKPAQPRDQTSQKKGAQQPKPKQSLAYGIFKTLGLF